MKTTEIITAHNVVIQYEIASLFVRIAAFFIDITILLAYFFILNILMVSMLAVRSSALFDNNSGVASLIYVLLLFPVFFYSFFMESFFGGQTIGKKAMGIRVVNTKGRNPSLGDLFLRWSFRLVEVLFSSGGIAIIAILVNEKNQRIGGIVSNTLVIQLKPSKTYSIKDILTLKDLSNYTPTYPQVTILNDDDVLLIKNTLERQKKYKNSNHNKVVLELSKKCVEHLKLKKEPKNKLKFLKTLVQDYVVLTRS